MVNLIVYQSAYTDVISQALLISIALRVSGISISRGKVNMFISISYTVTVNKSWSINTISLFVGIFRGERSKECPMIT